MDPKVSPLPFYDILNKFLILLLPQSCCDELLINLNIFHMACMKILLAKVLGYAIIVASVIVKLPQVIKLFQSQSSKGISFWGQLLELAGVTSTVCYSLAKGFPFSSYGEGVFLSIQTSMVAFLTLYYSGRKSFSFLFIFTYAVVVGTLSSPIAPFEVLKTLQTFNTPITAAGKLMQVVVNFRQGHTGQISVVTASLICLGSIARIFTSIQETGDILIVCNFIVSSVCNLVLVLQIFYYWNVEVPVEDDPKSKKE